jgi:hypothetical protein
VERIIIAASRTRWLIYFTMACCFIAAGILLLALHQNPLVAWLNILFFGAGGVVFALQLVDRRPRIVIDDQGVLDRTLKVGTIEWADIRGVFLKRSQGQPFLCLELADPSKYTARLSPLLRRMVQLNRKLGFTDLSLNLAGTSVSPDLIEELMRKELAVRSGHAAV